MHLQLQIPLSSQEPANKFNSWASCGKSLLLLRVHLHITARLVKQKAPAKRDIPLQPLSTATCASASPLLDGFIHCMVIGQLSHLVDLQNKFIFFFPAGSVTWNNSCHIDTTSSSDPKGKFAYGRSQSALCSQQLRAAQCTLRFSSLGEKKQNSRQMKRGDELHMRAILVIILIEGFMGDTSGWRNTKLREWYQELIGCYTVDAQVYSIYCLSIQKVHQCVSEKFWAKH